MTSSPPTSPVMITTKGSTTGRVYVARACAASSMPPPSSARRGEEPYNVCLVDLDDGVRVMGRVEGLAPQDVTIGLRVQAPHRRGRRRGLRPGMRGAVAIAGLAEYGLGVAPEGSTARRRDGPRAR